MNRGIVPWKQAGRDWTLYLFIVPSLVLIAWFAYTPTFSAIYHSFFDWSGGVEKRFVGFENYARAFRDSVFWSSFVTIGILVLANIVKLIPSIAVAVMIHRLKSERWQYWYRVLVVVPMVVPGLVVLFIWKGFFDPSAGALNQFLNATGLMEILCSLDQLAGWGVFQAGRNPIWLGQPELIIPALILWGFPWIGAVGVLVYLAGLQSIGTEVYESADLDGVNSLQKFFYIELPLILTQVRITLALLIIGTLQGFGFQLLLLGENGGPGSRGMVPGLWMYNRAFYQGEFGYACALGFVIFSAIMLLIYLNNKFVRVDK
jgi:raffinose/stachyose/melibiose transport system permease protein